MVFGFEKFDSSPESGEYWVTSPSPTLNIDAQAAISTILAFGMTQLGKITKKFPFYNEIIHLAQ